MSKLDPFGKYKREIWQQLADELKGDFIKGNMIRPDRLEIYYGNWMLTLDTHTGDNSSPGTRLRVPFVNRDDFIFKIFKEQVGHRISKALGMQDIIVGVPEFDQDFIIQGSDQQKLQMMFSNPHIRKLLRTQPKIILELRREAPLFDKPQFPKDVNEVSCRIEGIVKDLDQLRNLFDLFAHTLDHLCAIGTAYEDDPDFQYYT